MRGAIVPGFGLGTTLLWHDFARIEPRLLEDIV